MSRKSIQLKAKDISRDLIDNNILTEEKFTASNGWVQKFMNRNNLSLRRVTTSCQKVPADLISTLMNFFFYVRKLRMEGKYPDSHIYAADETAIWIDPYGTTCVTTKGAKEVAV